MKLWSKWVAALAIGAAFMAVPAAQAATAQPIAHSHANTVLVKKSKVASKTHKKAVVKHAGKKKVPAKHTKKLTAGTKTAKGKSGVKWHHPQLHTS